MRLSEYIKNLREKQSVSQRELADRVGVSKGYISRLESEKGYGRQNKLVPSLRVLNSIARAACETLDDMLAVLDDIEVDLSGGRTFMSEDTRLSPILTESDVPGAYDPRIADTGADFCLIASGETATLERVVAGDILLLRKPDGLNDGDVVAVMDDGDVSLRRVYMVKGGPLLIALSSGRQAVPADSADIVGRVIEEAARERYERLKARREKRLAESLSDCDAMLARNREKLDSLNRRDELEHAETVRVLTPAELDELDEIREKLLKLYDEN